MTLHTFGTHVPLEERLATFLDYVESDGEGHEASDEEVGAPPPMDRQESSHGPLHWNTRISTELQEVVDQFNLHDIYNVYFSVTIADPAQPDCPLVACSVGFTKLTGYTVQEIVGRNCRFLLNGVPPNFIDENTRLKCRAFCASLQLSDDSDEDKAGDAEELDAGGPGALVRGEICCVQTNAKKSGQLFRNMFYMKQVELDERPYILGLQAGLADDFDTDEQLGHLEEACGKAFLILNQNMTAIEQVLASKFWYAAPMRRQYVGTGSDGMPILA
jgi:hypothetical protein